MRAFFGNDVHVSDVFFDLMFDTSLKDWAQIVVNVSGPDSDEASLAMLWRLR